MGKSVAFAAAVVAAAVLVALVQAEAVATMSRAEAEASHYARLWAAGSAQHVQRDAAGVPQSWRCCRACASNTVPILHEAFEGDKDDAPEMKTPPPPPEKKEDKKLFLEVEADAEADAESESDAEADTEADAEADAEVDAEASAGVEVVIAKAKKARVNSHVTAEEKSEFAAAQEKRHHAQLDALHGVVSDATAYSCCNQCPDLMYPFPGTWNRPSPYSYAPPPRFRFAEKKRQRQQAVLAEVDATASASAAAVARAKAASAAATGTETEQKYVWTNPHNLPVYKYFESLLKAAAPRDPVQRDGKFDAPIRPGASPIWHPPPPPHDDIYRISRSPNLHDGFDLKTPPFLPPCCDFCMSTYFPHVINDELQLPKHEPYTISPHGKAFVEVGANVQARAQATAAGAAKATGNDDAMTAAEAFAKTQPSHKSDPAKCCHKCIRKDIEDTDWKIYALPEKPPKSKPSWKRW